MQIVQAPVNRALTPPTKLAWPQSALFASSKYRLVYCPIQKVACSSIKLWWAEIHGHRVDDFLTPVAPDHYYINHRKLNACFRLEHSPELADEALQGDDWFRVVFVRNPWARLVSTFLNKFIEPQPMARPVYRVVHRQWRSRTAVWLRDTMFSPLKSAASEPTEQLRDTFWPALLGRNAWADELTFRHFVQYLSSCDLDHDKVDMHWRPQYRFLGDVPFHFVGRLERLSQDMRTVADLIGVSPNLPAVNRTQYEPSTSPSICVADYPLRELRQLGSMPKYEQFYTRQLADQVSDLYRRDIEQFDYTFGE